MCSKLFRRTYEKQIVFSLLFEMGWARLGSAQPGSARPGPARPSTARPGSARLGSSRAGSAQLGWAVGSAWLGLARPGGGLGLFLIPDPVARQVPTRTHHIHKTHEHMIETHQHMLETHQHMQNIITTSFSKMQCISLVHIKAIG